MTHHQQPGANENAPLTTAAGAPVVDNQNSITAGPRGPVVLQDLWLIEKLAHFAREKALFDNTARAINGALPATVERHIDHCTKADSAYGDGVRRACQAIGAI